MSHEKVTIPREVAEAIEKARRDGYNNRMIIHASNGDMVGPYTLDLARYTERSGNFDILMRALVNGYIVEKSPEEKLRSMYEDYVKDEISGDYDRKFTGEAATNAIVNTLDILGITIEGIND